MVFDAIIRQSRISQDVSKLSESDGIGGGEKKGGMRDVVKAMSPFS